MENFALYLLKSAIWLTGFALVFILFLRNERFFFLNRIYLITGIIASFLLPFITIRYIVYIPVMIANEASAGTAAAIVPERNLMSVLPGILLLIYVSGAVFVALLIIRQCRSLLKSVRNAEVHPHHQVKLIRTADIKSSFSFFSFVFVNPSVSDIEAREILNHEVVHVRQKHWFDLLLAEMLCMIQWFNPMIWVYVRYIRQNHEYLADEVALQRSSDPAVYRAVLLNQIVGAPVVVLANSFNYSINLKRFKMMKNKTTSPYRKMKVMLILPVIAIVLYSFAKPEYRFTVKTDEPAVLQALNPDQDPVKTNTAPQQTEKKVVKGNMVPGAPPPPPPPPLYVIDGKISDKHYNTVKKENTESMKMLKPDIAVAKYGDKAKYGAVEITTKNPGATNIEEVSEKDAVAPPPPPPPPASAGQKSSKSFAPPPPPPPPSSGQQVTGVYLAPKASDTIRVVGYYIDPATLPKDTIRAGQYIDPATLPQRKDGIAIRGVGGLDGKEPLVVVDGLIYYDGVNTIDPNSIESITVMKDYRATDKYGDKARDGVIEITTKKHYSPAVRSSGQSSDEVTVVGYRQKSINAINEVTVKGYQSPESFPVNPLVVIDGVIVGNDADSLPKAEMINNISVLKGSSATKLYGERGQNGVIIITTKKAQKK
jgi:TonB-dependent SusC/RagA subfamily outer membrane receptor